ncbi:A/G-specific adenine DNA glycosylase [Heterostelium album PN500]|uniref:Adenine DNA glycosylase n=1 Tax=Heterostelium pallidum (strain ATCC 26659 / Pp 5 / PN500) TaxID=670386 RepID=D3B1J6_HETP5|nr:A/G-specific adenine DNA glycosylase [Heterostelium album PN500]EFA85170.1 A/G-specific adenine DNA glycosylase [Heterostelium album PN500]|eukprot:XP_020437279.1 A/G-specific adenine DNA glycosylase [Heterostelium album PN500]
MVVSKRNNNNNKIKKQEKEDENVEFEDVDNDDSDYSDDSEVFEDDDFDSEEERKLKKSKSINKKIATNNNKSKKKNTTSKIKIEAGGSNESIYRSVNHSIDLHYFKDEEIESIRESMLKWYSGCKRDLPWRQRDGFDRQTIAYRVWTRVSVVIDYFNRWIDNWPTIEKLAGASLDQVNQVWAGLGYYRRAKNLHLAATRLVKENNSLIPDKLQQLKDVEGYTAGAILSIAFEKQEPLVDGNVIRVLSRLRMIGANPKKAATIKLHWKLAGELVDAEQPGDFNQALMELGATTCLVTSPLCNKCPVSSQCLAYQQAEINKNKNNNIKKKPTANSITNYFTSTTTSKTTTTTTTKTKEEKVEVKREDDKPKIIDIEDLCGVCERWSDSDEPVESVTKFPRKVVKAKAREETVDVFIVINKQTQETLLVQRPETGLLASLWESPSIVREQVKDDDEEDDEDEDEDKDNKKRKRKTKEEQFTSYISSIQREFNDLFKIESIKSIGTTVHIFSHIRQTLVVNKVSVESTTTTRSATKTTKSSKESKKATQWIDIDKLKDAAISNQMKNCIFIYTMLPKVRYLHLDVFSNGLQGGNHLGVVTDATAWTDDQMIRFAKWTNLVETTFLLKPTQPNASYKVRIFTPEGKEIPFAGHPSIGSAFTALYIDAVQAISSSEQQLTIYQECGAGVLPIRITGDILMLQSPKARVIKTGVDANPLLAPALLGIEMGRLPPALIEGGRHWWIAECSSEESLRQWKPDHHSILSLAKDSNTLGICVFARKSKASNIDDKYDIVVRALPAGIGIVEDPASGAANGLIGAYIAFSEPNGPLAKGYIVSQGREIGHDAKLHIEIETDKIWVGGRTNIVVDGQLQWN